MGIFFKRLIYYFTPAKSMVVEPVTPEFAVAQEVPSLYISKAGHLVLGFLYSVALFGYMGLLIFNWVHRESFTEFSQMDTSDFTAPVSAGAFGESDAAPGPAYIQLYAWCLNPPHCGDITIRVNYSKSAVAGSGTGGAGPYNTDSSGCHAVVTDPATGGLYKADYPEERFISKTDTTQLSEAKNVGYKIPLCFNGDPLLNTRTGQTALEMPGTVTVEFSALNPGFDSDYGVQDPSKRGQGAVKVIDMTAPTTGAFDSVTEQGRPLRIVNAEVHQIKTLVMKQQVVKEYGLITNRSLASRGIQYDGKHTSWAGTVILAMTEKSDLMMTYKTHWLTIIGVLGSCAMAAWVVFVFALFVIPVWPLCFPGPAQQLINEHRAQARKHQ